MIGTLICGVVIGLIPAAIALIFAAIVRKDHQEIELAFEELANENRQVCSDADFAKREAARFMVERDAESERASANSSRVQQLQDELNRQRLRQEESDRRLLQIKDKLDRIYNTLTTNE